MSGGVNFDMLVSIVERAEGPRLQIEYNTVLFRRERICRLLDQYTRVLEAVMDDDTLAVSELPLLSPQEQSTLKLAGAGPALSTRCLEQNRSSAVHSSRSRSASTCRPKHAGNPRRLSTENRASAGAICRGEASASRVL